MRDNLHVQFRNCIFMDLGEDLVKKDTTGEASSGGPWGYNGSMSWEAGWTTDYNNYPALNLTPSILPAAQLYQVQTSGKLIEVKDSVFFRNLKASAYTESTARGVHQADRFNVTAANMPIQALTRGGLVVKGGKNMLPVTSINPCAANDAVTSVFTAPLDGFFTPAPFRGAFSAHNNWLENWTAVDAYNMTDCSMNQADPAASILLAARPAFPTDAGVVYTVEESSDMVNWSPIGTVVGDGTNKSVADLESFDPAKFYRVIRQ
jgi:hypothetical protein